MAAKQQIYDGIASKYELCWTVPASTILFSLIDSTWASTLADEPAPRVLELACGTGFYLRRLRTSHNCTLVAGIDISGDMIDEARNIDLRSQGDRPAINFFVGDCSDPTLDVGLQRGSFDMVMANFLFNYAKSSHEMLRMWQNVASYLKPGGVFIGLTQTFDPCPPCVDPKGDGKYGIKVHVVEQSREVVKQIMKFQTDPKVEFESFVLLDQKVWEKTAVQAGLWGLEFIYPDKDNVPSGEQGDFWNQILEHPWNSLMVAHKPI